VRRDSGVLDVRELVDSGVAVTEDHDRALRIVLVRSASLVEHLPADE
jgi:hypothetical protein